MTTVGTSNTTSTVSATASRTRPVMQQSASSFSAEKRQHTDVWNQFYEEEKRNLEQTLMSFMQTADRNLSPIGTPAAGTGAGNNARYLAEMPSFEQSQLAPETEGFGAFFEPSQTPEPAKNIQSRMQPSGNNNNVFNSSTANSSNPSINSNVSSNDNIPSRRPLQASNRPLQPINPNILPTQSQQLSNSRGFDQPHYAAQSTQQLIEQRKQLIIDALMKIRGKVHIQHEDTLKKQQTSLIATIDAKIKEEARRHKTAFPAHIRNQITALYLKNLTASLKVDENLLPNITQASDQKGVYQLSTADTNAVMYTTDYTLEQLKGLIDQYVKSKKDKAMQAINVEVSQLVDHSNRSLHLSQLNATAASQSSLVAASSNKVNLQEGLKKIMDEAKIQEDTVWNSILNAKSASNNTNPSLDKQSIDSIKTLYRKNMQVAAQICVLRQLQHQQQQGSR